jgi:pentose-5-phosphate-3-epimerase
MRGAGYFTTLDANEVARMLVEHLPTQAILDWVKHLIEWEMPLHLFIAEHEDPDVLISAFADAFPDMVSIDAESVAEDAADYAYEAERDNALFD